MNDLKEFLIEKDILNEEFLGEDAATVAAIALGIPTAGVLVAYGGALLLLAAAKGTRSILKIWNKAISELKSIKDFKKEPKFSEYYNRVREDPLVRKIYNSENSNIREYASVLKGVYDAIDKEQFNKEGNKVKEEFLKIPRNLQNSPDVKRAIINAIIKKIGEPPLWPPSPGNKTYQAIKFSIGIREAKAQATAFKLNAMKTVNKIEEEE